MSNETQENGGDPQGTLIDGDRSDTGELGSLGERPDLIGKGLRALRLQRGYTLSDVSQATDISKSFLSLVENGRSDITFARLIRLLRFYGVRITDLMPEIANEPSGIVRADARRQLDSAAEGIHLELLAPDTHRTMMPALSTLEPGGHNLDPVTHEGEGFLHVLEGAIVVELAGMEPATLNAGDSLYYEGKHAHRVTNPLNRPARVFVVLSPPSL